MQTDGYRCNCLIDVIYIYRRNCLISVIYMYKENLYKNNKKPFILFLISRNISTFANMIFYIYFMWIIVNEYYSVFLVSLIPAFSLLGYLIVAIPEGYIIDKYNRKKVFILLNLFSIIIYSVLFIKNSLLIIYSVDFFSSLLMWVISDDFRAITKEIIPEENIKNAQSMDQTSRGVAMFFGIILGGFFIFINHFFMYYFLVIISIISLVIILNLNARKIHKYKYNSNGFKYSFKIMKRIIPFLLLLMRLNGLFISLDVFSAGLIHIIMKASSIYYTLMILGYPAGMLLGGIISTRKMYSRLYGNEKYMVIYVLFLGFLLILISLNRVPILDSLFTFIIGIILAFINIELETLLINGIPSAITGKFNSITAMFSIGSSPAMAFIFGILSKFLYFPYIIAIAGIITIITSFTVISILKSFKMNISKIKDMYPELLNEGDM